MKTEKLEDIVRKLLLLVDLKHPLVVGIDGVNGSGKSTLAVNISKEITGRIINVDDYVEKNKGEYLSRVAYQTLQKAVNQFVSASEPIIIIEGVCLLNVLEKIKIQPDILVYIKRIGSYGFWIDDKLCDSEIPLEDALQFISRAETVHGVGNLDREIAVYHRNYSPLEKADFIFERVEA